MLRLLPLVLLLAPMVATAQPVTLARDHGAPFDRVAFGSIPEITDSLRVVVRAPGEAPYAAPIDRSGAAPQLVVPLHPAPLDGGDVALDVYDGDRLLGAVERFRIGALPRAPGTLERVLALHLRVVELTAARYGYGLADLREVTPDLPVHLWPPAIVLGALTGPDNPNSLRAILDGTAPLAADPSFDAAVADALAASLDAEALLQRYVDALEAVGPPPDPPTFVGAGPAPTPVVPPRGPHAGDVARWPAPQRVEIRSARQLSHYMLEAEAHRLVAADAGFEFIGGAGDHLGIAPHPVAQSASLAVSATLFLVLDGALMQAALLPSELFAPRAEFSAATFEEDFVEPGRWDLYLVQARSRSWNAGGTIGQGISELFFGVGAARGVWDGVQVTEGAAKASFDANVGQLGRAYGEMHASNRTKSVARQMGEFFGDENQIGPFVWGPVELTPTLFSEAKPVGTGAALLRVVQGDRTYRPLGVGESGLVLTPRAGFFPPQSNVSAGSVTHRVTTEPIEVRLTPSGGEAVPGQTVRVEASVEHALDSRVRWSVEASPGVAFDADGLWATLTFPPDAGPGDRAIVTAVSTSTAGLRSPSLTPPERSALAAFVVEGDADASEVCGEPFGGLLSIDVSGPEFGGSYRVRRQATYDPRRDHWSGLQRMLGSPASPDEITVTYMDEAARGGAEVGASGYVDGLSFVYRPSVTRTVGDQSVEVPGGLIITGSEGSRVAGIDVVGIDGPGTYGAALPAFVRFGDGGTTRSRATVTVDAVDPGRCVSGSVRGTYGEHSISGTFRVSVPPEGVLEVDARR